MLKKPHCSGSFFLFPLLNSSFPLRVNRERELNAQFEGYPILKANEPMASGYATFHVAVGLFGKGSFISNTNIIIPNGLEKETCTSTRFCLSIGFVVTVECVREAHRTQSS